MNIIIPIGGIGKRFKDEGYELPKPLINVLGRPMLYKVIESLKVDYTVDTIHIVYHSYLKEYNFESLLKFYFPKVNFNFTCLDFVTKGTSETVLQALKKFSYTELEKEILILDCDTFYNDDIINSFRKCKNKDVVFYFEDKENQPIYSYIEIQNNKVVRIEEKLKISKNASVGAYGFRSGKDLKKYCEDINRNAQTETYISFIYQKMLQERKNIYAHKVENFYCVGTPLQLKNYCSRYKYDIKNLRICFDLDNTLVTYPVKFRDFSSVKPVDSTIRFLKLLKKLGSTIVIYTDRNIDTDEDITVYTLRKFNIPYDEIYFGKPHADFFIDDSGINVNTDIGKEIGIYDLEISHRNFNKINYQKNGIVTKQTYNTGEIYWYRNIPEDIKEYFPKTFQINGNRLDMEYVEGLNYSYLFVNKLLKKHHLDDLKDVIDKIHLTNTKKQEKINIYNNYTPKIIERVSQNSKLYTQYGIYELIYPFLKFFEQYEKKQLGKIGIIHGDPVFTNIFETQGKIKFIDMRGKVGNVDTILGDVFYDYAKIYQSLLGYDFILVDREIDYTYIHLLRTYYESFFTEYELMLIKWISCSLIYTMLPLHTNEVHKFNKYIDIIKKVKNTLLNSNLPTF